MKKYFLGTLAIFAMAALVVSYSGSTYSAKPDNPGNGGPRATGGVTAAAGSTTIDLEFNAHPDPKGNVKYTNNSAGTYFKGKVDVCYNQEGNEAAFGGEITEGDFEGYFQVEVLDNGEGENSDPDRVRVRVFGDEPECVLSHSYPAPVIEGNLQVHQYDSGPTPPIEVELLEVQSQNSNGKPDNAGKPDDKGTVQGSAEDPNAQWLGEIKYLFNPEGYHFWFTPTASQGYYTEGHSYHNVYKYEVEDTSKWCGPVNIPNRMPYNAGGTEGQTAYYKIWDVTDEVYVCGTE